MVFIVSQTQEMRVGDVGDRDGKLKGEEIFFFCHQLFGQSGFAGTVGPNKGNQNMGL